MIKMGLKSLGKKALLIGGLIAILNGCNGDTNTSRTPRTLTLRGKPLSVSMAYGRYWGSLATVLEVDGKEVLASVGSRSGPGELVRAAALIQSEISDGDNEKVELIGKYYREDKFSIYMVRANGHTIDFR